MTTTRQLGGAIAVAIAVALSACQTPGAGNPMSSTTPARTAADYPIVWLPTPHLDLDSSDGTFVRAFSESTYRGRWLDWASISPGFAEAYYPHMRVSSGGLHPGHYRNYRYSGQFGRQPRVGPHLAYMWAAPFFTPDPNNDDDWTPLSPTVGGVAICVRASVPLPRGVDGPALQFLTYRRTGVTPPVNQRGNQPIATGNVFGGWHALDWISPTDQRSPRCNDMPAGAPPLTSTLRPSSPGWPANSQ